MPRLHFAGDTGSANCKHIQARDRSDLMGYFAYTIKRGESHGYDLEQLRSGFADWSGKPFNAAKEASMLLKNFNLINRSNELTAEAKVVATAYNDGRNSVVRELFQQHFRCFPTLAYLLDVLLWADQPLLHEEAYDRVMQYGSAESSIRENSIRNGLNLLADLNAVENTNERWIANRVSQPTIESTVYSLLLLRHDHEVIGSDVLRDRLPRLLLSDEEEIERVLHNIRERTTPFTIRTRGDRNRTVPYAGIFEIDMRETSPEQVGTEFFN